MHLIAPILIGIVFLLSLINWVSKTSKKDKKFGAFVNQLVIAGIVIGIICIIIGESIERDCFFKLGRSQAYDQ